MKLKLLWRYGNPTKAEVYLDGELIEGCKEIPRGIPLHPGKDGLEGMITGKFTYDETYKRIKRAY